MPTWKFGFGPPSMIEAGAPGFSKLMSRMYWPIRLKLGGFAAVSSAILNYLVQKGRGGPSSIAESSQARPWRPVQRTPLQCPAGNGGVGIRAHCRARSTIRELVSSYGIAYIGGGAAGPGAPD